jgi:hypothetical protein
LRTRHSRWHLSIAIIISIPGCAKLDPAGCIDPERYQQALQGWTQAGDELSRTESQALRYVMKEYREYEPGVFDLETPLKGSMSVQAGRAFGFVSAHQGPLTDERKFFCRHVRDDIVDELTANLEAREHHASRALDGFDHAAEVVGRKSEEPIVWYTSKISDLLKQSHRYCLLTGNDAKPLHQ